MTRSATTSEEKSSRSYWGFVLWPVAVVVLYVLSVGVLLTASSAGCARRTNDDSQVRPAGARLMTGEAVRVAEEAAGREGWKLSEYKRTKADFEPFEGHPTWFVSFKSNVGRPGDWFAVEVDDTTGKTRVMPGR